MKLIVSNPNPKQPDDAARIRAVIARAIMTDAAPASFFGTGFYLDDEQPTQTVKVGSDGSTS